MTWVAFGLGILAGWVSLGLALWGAIVLNERRDEDYD